MEEGRVGRKSVPEADAGVGSRCEPSACPRVVAKSMLGSAAAMFLHFFMLSATSQLFGSLELSVLKLSAFAVESELNQGAEDLGRFSFFKCVLGAHMLKGDAEHR